MIETDVEVDRCLHNLVFGWDSKWEKNERDKVKMLRDNLSCIIFVKDLLCDSKFSELKFKMASSDKFLL